jgi:PAS domain S-box-containing protein
MCTEEIKEIRVLHIDDDPDFLALARAFLKSKNGNLRVDTATSAEEGLTRLRDGTYDVVVSDYQMPVMNGLEFLQHLRESGDTIPFIMLTGRGREEIAMDALNKGANYYLQKDGDLESLYGTLAHTIREVVEKKRAEEALRKSEERYRLLAENVRDVIWTTDMNLRFTYVSPSVKYLRGYSAEEAMTHSLEEILTPTSFEVAQKVFAEELRLEKDEQSDPSASRTLELELTRKDGSTVWSEVKMTFLRDSNGRPVGILGVARDITERKQAEGELKQLHKELEAKNIEIERVIYLTPRGGWNK